MHGGIVATYYIQYCSRDATFVLKEVDMAIVADLGALQRLSRIVGYGNVADLTPTGRRITAAKAEEIGLVSRVFDSKQELDADVVKIAKVQTNKGCYSEFHTLQKSPCLDQRRVVGADGGIRQPRAQDQEPSGGRRADRVCLRVYYYTMRAVSNTDELQVAIDKLKELKKRDDAATPAANPSTPGSS
ncbi:Delta(3,5)-Delta(2,4)-dienoyl-CoA isomerase, mitochondrial [Hordeum vulgare]|nr:Delta(3,5)-Delta(2,4)-dienoyl-CoA isomerase, mitochondrial [Hordeum vulgare]